MSELKLFKKLESDLPNSNILNVWENEQGDLYMQICSKHLAGPMVLFCGSGGGSQYQGLANELKEVFKKY